MPRASKGGSSKPPNDLTLTGVRPHIRRNSHLGAGPVNSSTKLAMLAFLAALASPGYAQQAPKSKAPPHAAQTSPLPATAAPAATPPAENPAANAAPPPGWAARC